MYHWSKLKGINVLGTGDFTHPDWLEELRTKLEPAQEGLFQLKPEIAQELDQSMPPSYRSNSQHFILTVEISNIYSKGDQVRKLHNLVIAPDFKTVSKINAKLDEIGNLSADGRPILGLDSQELLKIVLDADPQAMLIPAHIWTPWFAMFGSKSGFDSIQAAFGDLSDHIYAVETGLSSDPFMNWRLSELDELTLISNSDAHSPYKLGREANLLDCELSYEEIIGAVKTNDQRFVGTIEFFPQEGKYHYDGHRKCDVCLSPEETRQHQGLCPKCGRPLVLGVDYRVDQLADRPADYRPKQHKIVEYIIPLPEIIAEVEGVKGTRTKTVQSVFRQLLQQFGDEFQILRTTPIKEIEQAGFPVIAEAVRRMRAEQIHIQPGYDGVYGVIKVFEDQDEMDQYRGQMNLGF